MTSVLTTIGMEVYPDSNELQSRSVCPKNEGMGCEKDEDCTTKISNGKLNEACTKCVCWHVPVCDIKKYVTLVKKKYIFIRPIHRIEIKCADLIEYLIKLNVSLQMPS